MLTFPHRHRLDGHHRPDGPAADPWAGGHAAPEDRALGHELELIELQRRRDELAPDHPEVARIDHEIAEVLDDLVAVTSQLDVPAPRGAAA